jgi:hypothetical protein
MTAICARCLLRPLPRAKTTTPCPEGRVVKCPATNGSPTATTTSCVVVADVVCVHFGSDRRQQREVLFAISLCINISQSFLEYVGPL